MAGSLPCPERLQFYTDEQFENGFRQTYSTNKLNLKLNDKKSLFGKTVQFLTGTKKSTHEERSFLYTIWEAKFKDTIHTRKSTKFTRQSFKGKGRPPQSTQRNNEVRDQVNLAILDVRSKAIQKRIQDKTAKPKNKTDRLKNNTLPENVETDINPTDNSARLPLVGVSQNHDHLNQQSIARNDTPTIGQSSNTVENVSIFNSERRFSLRRYFSEVFNVTRESLKRVRTPNQITNNACVGDQQSNSPTTLEQVNNSANFQPNNNTIVPEQINYDSSTPENMDYFISLPENPIIHSTPPEPPSSFYSLPQPPLTPRQPDIYPAVPDPPFNSLSSQQSITPGNQRVTSVELDQPHLSSHPPVSYAAGSLQSSIYPSINGLLSDQHTIPATTHHRNAIGSGQHYSATALLSHETAPPQGSFYPSLSNQNLNYDSHIQLNPASAPSQNTVYPSLPDPSLNGIAADQNQNNLPLTPTNNNAHTQPLLNITATSQVISQSYDGFLYSESERIQREQEKIQQLDKLYNDKIYVFPTHQCPVCSRMLYPFRHNKKRVVVDNVLRQELHKFDCTAFDDLEEIYVCSKCNTHLQKHKIPPQAYFNNLTPSAAPPCISDLTEIEIRIISQVKPHMRIFHLCKGRGQAAIKGSCIHFPLQIEEVIEQLPLNRANNDLIIVNESGHSRIPEYQVRPAKIREALLWLKENNHLYENVQLQDVSDDDLQLHEVITNRNGTRIHDEPPAPPHEEEQPAGYQSLPNNRAILRANKSQADYYDAANQCTGMAAVAIAFSFYQDPITWTSDALKQILDTGNEYYKSVRDLLYPDGNNHCLDAREVEGEIRLFGEISLQLFIDGEPIMGGFNKYPDAVFPEFYVRLNTALTTFIDSNINYAIFTANGYSTAIIKSGRNVYYFDSHPRTERGRKGHSNCRLRRGREKRACIIKYCASQAVEQISEILHHNYQPTESFVVIADEEEVGFNINNRYNRYSFVLQPLSVFLIPQEEVPDNQEQLPSVHVQGLPLSEERDNQLNSNLNSQQHASNTAPQPSPMIFQPEPFVNRIMVDSVIQADDFIEPEVQDFRDQVSRDRVNLQRQRGRPLFSDKHSRLEELSFVKCFPHGVNGRNERRTAKLTTLFYALAQVDKDTVENKIAICGKMKKQGDGNVNNEDQRLHIDENTAHTIMVAIRGTSSYWKKYGGDITAMIAQLGAPHLFLTISYDDLYSKDSLTAIWKSKHGPFAEVNPDDLTYSEKRDAINENPVASARHFCNRVGALFSIMKTDSTKIFGKQLADFTYRVEFQDRGAPHVHAMIWLQEMPSWNTPEGIEFIDKNISCSLDVCFKSLVEKYQSHRHSQSCFKKKNGVCRFAFPKAVSMETRIYTEEEMEKNKGRFVELKRKENETYINNYHPILLQILKCNMDIQVITNSKAVAYYIAKYISKAEPDECRAETSNAIKEIQADLNSSYYAKAKKIATLIMKQREVGAPEAGFRFARLPLRMSSRSFIFVGTYKPQDRTRMIRRETVGTGSEQFCLNVFDRYINRPAELAQLCLLEFVAYYKPAQRDKDNDDENEDGDNIEYRDEEDEPVRQQRARIPLRNGKGSIVRRGQAAIVKSPQFDPLSQQENYYYSLIVLYQPFTVESFLDDYPSVTDAFQALRATFRTHADDPAVRPELAQELQIALVQLLIPRSIPNSPEEHINDTFGEDVQNIFEEVYEPLSEQEVFQAPNILADANNGQNPPPPETLLQERLNTMNAEQRQIYIKVRTKLFNPLSEPLRLFVQGEAGCGKSWVIDSLSVLIETLNRTAINGRKTIVRAALTGVAAKNIAGVTLHKLFSLSIERNDYVPKIKKLGGQKLQERRNVLRNVEWVIIDEISMVNYQTLHNIDSRLRDIFSVDEPFANKNILLFGDLLQLKPVLGSWCFQQPVTMKHELNLWNLFTIYELTTVVRQRNDNIFRNLLGKLRTGDLMESDMGPLRERVLISSNPRYQELLQIATDSLHIYPYVSQVDGYNQQKMEELRVGGNSIHTINCIDKIADPDRYGALAPESYIPRDDRKCGGIPSQLLIAIGCRIMLRRNISVEGGLVNGSMGTVGGIGWAVRRDGPISHGEQPQYIAIQFDDAVSSNMLDQDGYYRLQANSFEFDGNYHHRLFRVQFPIVLCYACTVHKVQGLTLARAAIYLGREMFTAGMAYVALSRLRSLDGLVILKLDDSRVLWTKKVMKPCNMVAYAEIIRLRIARELPNVNDEEQREIASWMVDYPLCKKCKSWICMCVCNKQC